MKDGAKIFLRDPKTGKYYFVLRDDKPYIPNPNMWSLFGGGIDPGEDPQECVQREVYEELGANIEQLELLKTIDHRQKKGDEYFDIKIHIYKGDLIINGELELTEGQKFGLYSLDEIRNMNTVPRVVQLIEELKNKLQ